MQRSSASENSAESSVFNQFLAAHHPRARADSLSEAMSINPPYQRARPQQTYLPAQQQVYYQPAQQQFEPPWNFGLKILTLKDVKLPIERFSGKAKYERLGAGFTDWGLWFLDELVAAQVISGGDCPEDFKARALNRYLEGSSEKAL
ncbi:hypothetical protein PC121_g9839 [Phytophthora cactorum]|nr:hypothetical protein PC120_g6271 [Phytophthora cactorum]KAG3069405.1 hypothetical protein PC121_g9839 [Phytophthora cactorum]